MYEWKLIYNDVNETGYAMNFAEVQEAIAKLFDIEKPDTRIMLSITACPGHLEE